MIVALPGAVIGRDGEYERLVRLIAIGTLPLVPAVVFFMDTIEAVRSPAVVAGTLALGGVGLLVAERAGDKRRDATPVTHGEAVGVAQACALAPGVSRSGATI